MKNNTLEPHGQKYLPSSYLYRISDFLKVKYMHLAVDLLTNASFKKTYAECCDLRVWKEIVDI